MTDVDTRPDGRAVEAAHSRPARANHGRWVVDCFTPWCTNAWMPNLGDPVWVCEVCGLPTDIVWPPDPIAIEAVLLMRPDPASRNWEPGETVADLVMENAAHGIVPPGTPPPERWADPDAATDLITEVDGCVVGGLVYGPVEAWRLARGGTDPSITAAGEPVAYRLEN